MHSVIGAEPFGARSATRRATLLLLGVLLSVASCQKRDYEPTPAERGARIYALRCAPCHGARGEGRARVGLPTPPEINDPSLFRRFDDPALEKLVATGRGAMPAFGKLLSSEEIALVVDHLHTLEKKP